MSAFFGVLCAPACASASEQGERWGTSGDSQESCLGVLSLPTSGSLLLPDLCDLWSLSPSSFRRDSQTLSSCETLASSPRNWGEKVEAGVEVGGWGGGGSVSFLNYISHGTMGLAAVISKGETPGPSGSRSPRARKGHFPRLCVSKPLFPKGGGHVTRSLGPRAQEQEQAEGQKPVPWPWKVRADRVLPSLLMLGKF